MTKFHSKRWLAVSVFISLPCLGQAQQASGDSPLGDVARGQRQIHRDSKQTGSVPKTYTNTEVTAAVSEAEAKATSSVPEQSSATPKPKRGTEPTRHVASEGSGETSILDRPKDANPDEIIVPAGSEIRVDVYERKIVNPVRVGFSTPIPALSRVAVRVDRSYVPSAYSANGSSYLDYVDYATLKAVTIGDMEYALQAEPQPLLPGATNRDVTFVLSAPLRIPR